MPTRKQQRRERKRRIHGQYDRTVPDTIRSQRREEKAVTRGAERKPVVGAGGREIKAPSLMRALKRAGIFVPIMAAIIYATGRDRLTGQQMALQLAVIALLVVPLTYLSDSFVYRWAQRRQAK